MAYYLNSSATVCPAQWAVLSWPPLSREAACSRRGCKKTLFTLSPCTLAGFERWAKFCFLKDQRCMKCLYLTTKPAPRLVRMSSCLTSLCFHFPFFMLVSGFSWFKTNAQKPNSQCRIIAGLWCSACTAIPEWPWVIKESTPNCSYRLPRAQDLLQLAFFLTDCLAVDSRF